MRKLLQGGGGELVNYDYFDIAEGTGIKNFYAAQSEASGAIVQCFLTADNTVFSNKITEKTTSTATADIRSNLNYDVMFNLPKLVYGKARCSISLGVEPNAKASEAFYAKLFLYHYRGTTSTLMASGATLSLYKAGAGVTSYTYNVPLDLTSKKWHFKKGDALRLNVQLIMSPDYSADAYVGYGCDPQDRDDIATASGAIIMTAATTTQLKLAIPFLIDI